VNDFKIVFIHGYTASHLADWYPNISKELNQANVDYIIPDLPGDTNPHAEDWLKALHEVISKIDKPIILVGHSLGTRAALLYLEKFHPKMEKVFLIAAFANDTKNAFRHDDKDNYKSFFDHVIDLEKIKPLVKKFIVMHSKDDNTIEYKQGVEISKDLSAELITYDNKGHFFKPEYAPIVFEELRKELKF
jgi:hypothetical protein